MESFIHEDAILAVKRGINWLDENHPNWANEIDLSSLDMSECNRCVIGQAVGDYTFTVKQAAKADYIYVSDWAIDHGFESPLVKAFRTSERVYYGFNELDTLWSKEVRARLG